MSGEIEYFIEKAIKSYSGFTAEDVIFEYAICIKCAERLRKQMSAESMQSIQDYFSQEVNFMDRMQTMQANPNNPTEWMQRCLINGSNIEDLEEYQIYAHCKGNTLITSHMPYMISGVALDKIAGLLSDETLDELDDFMNNHFGPPPELMEPLPKRRVIPI
ncbi:hypothetical protein E1176_01380 [Fulvivirga sp. RKSG066]|nr:hypothetical protein [Fulvivirga aurantia]